MAIFMSSKLWIEEIKNNNNKKNVQNVFLKCTFNNDHEVRIKLLNELKHL